MRISSQMAVLLIVGAVAFGQDQGEVQSTFDALEAIAAEPDERLDAPQQQEPATNPDKPRIAVFEFKVRGNLSIPDAGAIIAEFMSSALAETQRFTLMERALLDKILEEQEFQSSYLSDESTMVEAGKLFGVEAIVSGTLSKWGRTISISVRLIDTSTGVVRASAQANTQSEDEIPHRIGLLAKKLAGPTSLGQPSETDLATTTTPSRASAIEHPSWLSVRIHPSERLHLGDEMRLEISSARAGELLVVDIDPRGQIAQIFPYPSMIPCETGCRLRPGNPMVIPSPFDGIRFAAREPLGTGHILAILSNKPLDVDDLDIDRIGSGEDVQVQLTSRIDDHQLVTAWVAEARYVITP